MKIRYADDDGGLIDPMDAYKEREIERLENERRQVEPWAAMMAAMGRNTRQPAFVPHCPKCYGKLAISGNRVHRICSNCGADCNDTEPLYLRSLPPCPAPPYTQDEVNQLCAPSC